MIRCMLVGRSQAGKTTFSNILTQKSLEYQKTQDIIFTDTIIDTPGEYLENRSLYRALIVTAIEADCIILFQDCTNDSLLFAPNFATMFFDKLVIGVVSKIDLAINSNQIKIAEDTLIDAGCSKVFHLNNFDNKSVKIIYKYLESI